MYNGSLRNFSGGMRYSQIWCFLENKEFVLLILLRLLWSKSTYITLSMLYSWSFIVTVLVKHSIIFEANICLRVRYISDSLCNTYIDCILVFIAQWSCHMLLLLYLLELMKIIILARRRRWLSPRCHKMYVGKLIEE